MVAIQEVEALSREIATEFDPERIILFGSHARGDAAETSDVDLLIIADSEKIIWVWPIRMSEQAKIAGGTPKILQLQITDINPAH